MLQDATHYGPHGAESGPRAWWAAPTPFNPNAPTTGRPLIAFVNDGRWVVACTVPRCGGAQLAALDDPRFMCVTCGNAANGGAWLPVTFPEARQSIATALAGREKRDQNWLPGESVADLLAENVTIGVRA